MPIRYEPVPYWAKIPHGIWLQEATSVAVDSQDRIYVFNRGNMPVLVFDPEGNVVDMWGNDDPGSGTRLISDAYGNQMQSWPGNRWLRAHSIRTDHQDNLWLVDVLGHTITKTDRSGNELMKLGTGEASPAQGGAPFNRPTDVAVNPANGDIYVSDGYRNSRVHRFDAGGKLLQSWGESGSDPGQFSLPHNICMFGADGVIVADRENHRVQVFSLTGDFQAEWHVHHAVAVTHGRAGDENIYVAEQGPPLVQFGVPNLGHRVSIYNRAGELQGRFGAPLPGERPNEFLWPHSIAVDSKGDVYVAEVSYTEVGSRLDPAREMASLRKWRKVDE
ncbi:MAG: peptidyl-alpha-hydroxyglycine alpha-amidating lyase family protein [Dehalococcoidia bacterium]